MNLRTDDTYFLVDSSEDEEATLTLELHRETAAATGISLATAAAISFTPRVTVAAAVSLTSGAAAAISFT